MQEASMKHLSAQAEKDFNIWFINRYCRDPRPEWNQEKEREAIDHFNLETSFIEQYGMLREFFSFKGINIFVDRDQQSLHLHRTYIYFHTDRYLPDWMSRPYTDYLNAWRHGISRANTIYNKPPPPKIILKKLTYNI